MNINLVIHMDPVVINDEQANELKQTIQEFLGRLSEKIQIHDFLSLIHIYRSLDGSGIYPPVGILPSLSRLMKDGIGAEFTRDDHKGLSDQLFAAYAKTMEARSLASVIGEEELATSDKRYIEFGKLFESRFITQGFNENRTIEQSLDLGWELLSTLPRVELDVYKRQVSVGCIFYTNHCSIIC